MKVTDVVTELELEMEESQNERDARVENLWKKLDHQKKGELDWKALQTGLKKIDHPLKNADDLLKNIIKVVDTNGDGKIQYEEFRVFVEAAERQLYLLFKSIDHNHDGKLDRQELQAAFQRSGVAVPMRRVATFFEDIDRNHDGYISFDEWRNFLLFMPNQEGARTLRAVFTFYSDVLTLNSEGDSVLNDETLEGLGTTTSSLIQALFGSILRLAYPTDQKPDQATGVSPADSRLDLESSSAQSSETSNEQKSTQKPQVQEFRHSEIGLNDETYEDINMESAGSQHLANAAKATTKVLQGARSATIPVRSTGRDSEAEIETGLSDVAEKEEDSLISYLPDLGYFVAGAVAGGISRTATAPLDRLKVYLLINTKNTPHSALDAAKSGQPLVAVQNAGRSFINAYKELLKCGGWKGLWAGNGLNVIKIMPETAIRFGAYEAAKKTLARLEGHGDIHHINPYSKFVAGGVAGMTAQFVVYPLDTFKFRLQSEYVDGGSRGITLLRQIFSKMRAEGGIPAYYRGVTMGLIGMFPYSAIDMGTFEFLKTRWVTYKAKSLGIHEEDAQPSSLATGIMGATSGAFGASVVYPLNVLRTRLQTQGTAMHPARYTGIVDVARKTIKNEGWRGLYKGLMPNLLKVAPALSITWMVYEKAKTVMQLH
ncbi:mitochondrial carrier domain-containing protein [Xylariales sp. PMI_506]|nr:mitochondrial carrier domain-containing protein [Xylariales sp. PMI_506]